MLGLGILQFSSPSMSLIKRENKCTLITKICGPTLLKCYTAKMPNFQSGKEVLGNSCI